MSKAGDVSEYGWSINACCLDGALDAVSWTDGSNQRQRVFFERSSVVNQLNYDNDGYNAWGPLPAAPPDAVFADTGVAALVWDYFGTGTMHMAVAAISTNGRVCVWEGTVAAGFTTSPYCTGVGWANTSSADIAGAVASWYPVFAYKLSSGGLGRTRWGWNSASLGTPPGQTSIVSSVDAFTSVADPTKVEIVVGGGSGGVYTGRIYPLSTLVSWQSLPAMPNGAQPSLRAAFSTAPYSYFDWSCYCYTTPVAMFVHGNDNRLYRIHSTTSGEWTSSWLSGSLGSGATPPEDE